MQAMPTSIITPTKHSTSGQPAHKPSNKFKIINKNGLALIKINPKIIKLLCAL